MKPLIYLGFSFNIISNLTKKTKEEKKNSYEGCLTFECISSKKQLILPFLYVELISGEEVSFNEIQILENFLSSNHKEEKIANFNYPFTLYKGNTSWNNSKIFIKSVYRRNIFLLLNE